MMEVVLMVIVSLFPCYCIASNGINNFHFIGTNVIYGTQLPKTISIHGTYFLNQDEAELDHLIHSDFFRTGSLLDGNNPWSIAYVKGDVRGIAKIQRNYWSD